MKRSQAVSLVLALGAGYAAYKLGAADVSQKEEQALVYRTAYDCVMDGKRPAQECEAEYAAAKKLHDDQAPRFGTRPECEAAYGADGCTPVSAGSAFVPAMTGFLIGRALSQGLPAQPLYPVRAASAAAGAAASSPRTYRTFRGGTVTVPRSGGSSVTASTTMLRGAQPAGVQRGGFGATGRSFSGFSVGG